MNKLFTFEYEPKSIDEMVLVPDIKVKLKKFIIEKPNVLLYGGPGVGKGTFCNIFLKETNSEYLKINASDENSVDDVRTKIKTFATSVSFQTPKIIILNECLEENEEIRVGRLDDINYMKMKDLPIGVFDIPSINMKTGEIEDDTGEIVSDKIDDIYEVVLDDGRTIKTTLDHPFLYDTGKSLEQIKLSELNIGDTIICLKEDSDFLKEYNIVSITRFGKNRVINLNVRKNHTIISKNGILTHNCDHLSLNAQAAIRDLQESVQKITRFIYCCNYINKVIPEIVSRCQVVHITNPPATDIYKHCVSILNKEKIKYDKKVIVDIIKSKYPDIRQIINCIQLNVNNGVLDDKNISTINDVYSNLFDLMKKQDIDEVRKVLKNNPINYGDIYRYLFDNVGEFKSPGDAIIEIGESSYRNDIVAIKEIQFMSMLMRMYKGGIL
jgi:DNA polymerase III delta prime subunit